MRIEQKIDKYLVNEGIIKDASRSLIREEYKTRKKGIRGNYELFGSPISMKDLQNAANGGEIRFIADLKGKKLWVWDAEADLHGDVWDETWNIGGDREAYDLMDDNALIWGVAEKKGNKWIMNSSHELEGMDGKSHYDESNIDFSKIIKNFKWLDRLINVSRWLKRKSK